MTIDDQTSDTTPHVHILPYDSEKHMDTAKTGLPSRPLPGPIQVHDANMNPGSRDATRSDGSETPHKAETNPTGEAPFTGRSKSELPPGVFRRNFLNDFPKGMGMGPEAPVWTNYMNFSTQYDKEMLDNYNGGMENLLVFAALFSAIVTAFLMMSLGLLFPEYDKTTANALVQVSAQLAALGAPGTPMPDAYEAEDSTISLRALYINALWIFSLSISLTSSVLAMLVKEWLRNYDSDWPSTPREHAHQRQFRYDGLCKWQVPAIAESLPLLLQVSVALFLAGFLVYLWPISAGLRWLLLFLFISGGVGYVGLAICAVIWTDCPYRSPLTVVLDVVWCYSRRVIALAFSSRFPKERRYTKLFGRRTPYLADILFDLKYKDRLGLYMPMSLWVPLIPKRLRAWVNDHGDSLDESAISWLSEESFDLATAKGVVTACFSSPKYETFGRKHRGAIQTAALRCLRPEAGEAELTSWDEVKQKLTEAAIARTFADWGQVDDPYYAWYNRLWTLSPEQVPNSDRFLYYSLLVTCAGPYPRCGSELQRSVRRWIRLASDKLIETLRDDGENVSSLGCWLFSSYLSSALRGDSNDFWDDRVENLRGPMLRAMSTSTSLPIEVLFSIVELRKEAARRDSPAFVFTDTEFWIPTLPADTKFNFFYQPMLTAPVHGDLEIAAIKYATNELRSRSPNTLVPEDGIKLILGWFQANRYLPHMDQNRLANPELIRREATVELDFLQACREAQVERNQYDTWNADLVKICQLVDVEKDDWNYRELSGGRIEYHDSFDKDLEKLLQHAAEVDDNRGVIIGLTIVAQGLFAGRSMKRSLAMLLSSLQTCDLVEVVIAEPARCDHLCKILLHWLYRKAPFSDNVVALVQRLEGHGDHPNLTGNRLYYNLMKQHKQPLPILRDDPNPSRSYSLWRVSHFMARMLRNRSVDHETRSVQSFEGINGTLARRSLEQTTRVVPETRPDDGNADRPAGRPNLQTILRKTGNFLQIPAMNTRTVTATDDMIDEKGECSEKPEIPARERRMSTTSMQQRQSSEHGEDDLTPLRTGITSLWDRIPLGNRGRDSVGRPSIDGSDGAPDIEVTAPDGHVQNM